MDECWKDAFILKPALAGSYRNAQYTHCNNVRAGMSVFGEVEAAVTAVGRAGSWLVEMGWGERTAHTTPTLISGVGVRKEKLGHAGSKL